MDNDYTWTILAKDIILVILCYIGIYLLYTLIECIQELVSTINNAILNPPLESKNESNSIRIIKLRFDDE